MNISDIADTESGGLRNLSRIDDKSTLFQLCVESFEIEIGQILDSVGIFNYNTRVKIGYTI